MTHEEAVKIMGIVKKYYYPQLMCSDTCVKFMQVMDVFGVECRHVALTRPSTTPLQGHSVCEIKLKGKWKCVDVAFNWMSRKGIEEIGKKDLLTHPIYKTHTDELLELYANYEFHPFTKKLCYSEFFSG